MTKEDTSASIEAVDNIIKTLEFGSKVVVIDGDFLSGYNESQLGEMVMNLLCLRNRLINDSQKYKIPEE